MVETKKEDSADVGHAFAELTRKLHSARLHPDFEYCSTIKIHASGYQSELHGEGWEPNPEYQHGQRDDGVKELKHWRRLNSVAAKEDVHVYEAIEHRIEKTSLMAYVEELGKRINDDYMPRSQSTRKYNSKPYYVSSGAIRSLINGSGYYQIDEDVMRPPTSDGPACQANVVIRPKSIYFGLHIPKGIIHSVHNRQVTGLRRSVTEYGKVDLELLTNLKNPLEETYLRACRGDGSWMPWEVWKSCSPLALNRYEVLELLDTYC